MEYGFSSEIYKSKQSDELHARALDKEYDRLYIEIGGKLIDDNHAARVLPGYDKDIKLDVLNVVFPSAEFVCGVSALDIDGARERADFGIKYDDEALRLISDLQSRGQNIKKLIITRVAAGGVSERVRRLIDTAESRGLAVFLFPDNPHYLPDDEIFPMLDKTPFIDFDAREIIITAPGAGSGKFGICLSQFYNEMKNGRAPAYMKMETFPVFNLPVDHPVNLAYAAATAELGDEILIDENDASSTSYNRDQDNFRLLQFISANGGKLGEALRQAHSMTDLCVNHIKDGIINDDIVCAESAAEIARRFMRCQRKDSSGAVLPVLRRLLAKM